MIDWQQKTLGPLVNVFGQSVVYTRGSERHAIEYPLSGIFDEAYLDVDAADGLQVATRTPCLGINLADLPFTPAQKDNVLIKAAGSTPAVDILYIVKKVREDGHGGCKLLLNIAPKAAHRTSATGTQDQ